MDSIDTWNKVLLTVGGRDKAIRTMGYALHMIAGQSTGDRHAMYTAMAKQMSLSRTIMRQFTDIPMIMASKSMLMKPNSTINDKFSYRADTLVTLLYTVYNPIEHVAYLADHKLINADSSKWWKYCVYIWATCLFITIIKLLRNYFLLEIKKGKLHIHSEKQALKDIASKQSDITLDLTIAFADFMNAINGCPKGFLWGQTLTQSRSGFYGVIASALGFYKLCRAARPAPTQI